jgi:hypothetical protein
MREGALGNVTTARSEAGPALDQVQVGLTGLTSSTPAARPDQPTASQATALSLAVDQVLELVLDADPHDTLIGDLAFEQISFSPGYPLRPPGSRPM